MCSTVFASQALRLKMSQLRARKPVARTVSGSSGGQLVAGEHLLDHPVVALVGVERLDDPVAPVPDMRVAVAGLLAQPIPVAVSPDVHPVPPPALAMTRAASSRSTTFSCAFGGVISEEGVESCRVGREADQVEVDAAEPEVPGDRWGRLETARCVSSRQEGVDRIAGPGCRGRAGVGGRAGAW